MGLDSGSFVNPKKEFANICWTNTSIRDKTYPYPAKKEENGNEKLIALVLAALMVLGCTAAFAEEVQTLELNWEDFAQQIEEASEEVKAAWAGDFVTMEEDCAVAVQYMDMDGMTLEEYAQLLTGEQLGIEECHDAVVNGLPALFYSFTEEEAETSVLAFATERGYILEVSFGPTNDDCFAAVATVMMGSIQAAE